MSNFDFAFEFTVGNEGGYSNHPADRGGPTKFGITQKTLSLHFGRSASVGEVKGLSIDVAKSIYEKNYWFPMSLDELAGDAIPACIFDIGVVMGIGVAPKLAQRACNACGHSSLIVDGHMGPKTISAINDLDEAPFIKVFSSLIEARFRAIVSAHPTQKVFLNGWVNRAHRLLTLI